MDGIGSIYMDSSIPRIDNPSLHVGWRGTGKNSKAISAHNPNTDREKCSPRRPFSSIYLYGTRGGSRPDPQIFPTPAGLILKCCPRVSYSAAAGLVPWVRAAFLCRNNHKHTLQGCDFQSAAVPQQQQSWANDEQRSKRLQPTHLQH